MSLGIAVALIIITIFILKSILSFSLKLIGTVILIAVVSLTIYICSVKPDMHKPFSLSTIEYLFKINKDGSISTTKQITKTVIKDDKVSGGKQ